MLGSGRARGGRSGRMAVQAAAVMAEPDRFCTSFDIRCSSSGCAAIPRPIPQRAVDGRQGAPVCRAREGGSRRRAVDQVGEDMVLHGSSSKSALTGCGLGACLECPEPVQEPDPLISFARVLAPAARRRATSAGQRRGAREMLAPKANRFGARRLPLVRGREGPPGEAGRQVRQKCALTMKLVTLLSVLKALLSSIPYLLVQ